MQKAYRGYDNSLTKLTTRLVADQVRLVFTGTNIEIYEVMCLDRGGEILDGYAEPVVENRSHRDYP